jgi:hypothetical protein
MYNERMKGLVSKLKSVKYSLVGLQELGKGVIAFANLMTALTVVNIIYRNDMGIFFIILAFINYILLYFIGYKLIKKGDVNV